MSINAEVTKSGSEPVLSVIRKFSRRVQGTGLVKTVRSSRYYSRDTSKAVKKKRALKLIKRRAEYRRLIKDGKIIENQRPNRPNRVSFPTTTSAPRPAASEPSAPKQNAPAAPAPAQNG